MVTSSKVWRKLTAYRYRKSSFCIRRCPSIPLRITGKQKTTLTITVLVAAIGEARCVLVANKSKDVHAGNLIQKLAPIVDGRGGGKPDMAMAGGNNKPKNQELLDAVVE